VHSGGSGRRRRAVRATAGISFVVIMTFAVACAGGGDARETGAESAGDGAAAQASSAGFASGPAVLIPSGYQAPADRVDSTGAYLPVNDLPTLVYLEAIW
jgi:hypothetical protein